MGMMNDLDLAQSLFRKPSEIVSEAFGGRLPAYTVEAEAMEDSADGMVAVQFMGDTMNLTDGDPDGDGAVTDELSESGIAAQWVSVPCSASVKAGDRVLVTIQDGAPIDCTTIGWGDTVSTVASRADAIATATNQHFWSDTNGIHVSTDEGDAAGANNILINSLGILLRELTTVLLELSSAGVIVGDQSGTHLSVDSNSVDVINSDGDTLLTMRGGTRNSAYLTANEPTGFSNMTMRVSASSAGTGDATLYLNSTSDTSAISEAYLSAFSPTSAAQDAAVQVSSGNGGQDSKIRLNAKSIRVNEYAPFVWEQQSAISVSSTAAGNNANGNASIAKTGYTPVGFQWWWSAGTRQNFFNDFGCHIEGDTFYYRFCNVHSSLAANGTLQVKVLYVRNELL